MTPRPGSSEPGRALGNTGTAAIIFALGATASLLGDAAHVAAGTTRYLWDLPAIGRSAFWFPLAVGSAVAAAAWAGRQFGLPARAHPRIDAVPAVAAVVGLYALTAVLRGTPDTASVTLCGAVALCIWWWWDPSPRALAVASSAAIVGPAAEIAVMASGAAEYAADSDALFGVAPWLPWLYFAAGAVASGLWRTLAQPAGQLSPR